MSKLNQSQLIDLIKTLERNRASYPNWVVMPLKQQDHMFHSTDAAMRTLQAFDNLPSPWDIKGLYELNWRCEHCLMPLINSVIPTFRKIVQKYNPAITKLDRGLWELWRNLVFAIYRWCREELQIQERQEWEEAIEKFCTDDLDAQNRLCFEKVMWAFAVSDAKLLDDAMACWRKMDRPPLWNVRFASFLCETGQVEQATLIYEAVLAQIRPSIPKGKIKNDYYLLSLEGIVLTALHNAHAAIRYRKTNTVVPRFGLECSQRLEVLAAMDCDPNVLMVRFKLLMAVPEKREIGEVKTREFDMITRSWQITCGWPQDCKNAYQFARFTEEIGIPLYIDCFTNYLTSSVPGCVCRLVGYSAGWALGLYNRIGNTDTAMLENFISQRKEAAMPRQQVDEIIARYCEQMGYLIERSPEKLMLNSTSVHRRMAMVMFEALSRLTSKASQESLTRLFQLGMKIESSSITDFDMTFKDFYSCFYRRVISAMCPETLYENLEKLLKISIPPENRKYWRWWHCPISFVEWRGLQRQNSDCSHEVCERIDAMIQLLLSDQRVERTAALLSLSKCMDLGVCTEQQKILVSQNLEKRVGADGLPDVDRFYKHAFFTFLKPTTKREVIEQVIVNSYLNFNFESVTVDDVKDNRCNHMSRMGMFAETILSTSSAVRVLSQNEIRLSERDCHSLWRAFRSGFEVSMERVASAPQIEWNMNSGLQERLAADIYYYDRILGEVIIPGVTSAEQTAIAKWLDEVSGSGTFLCSRLMLECQNKGLSDELKLDIVISLTEGDENVLVDGFRAAYNWCRLYTQKKILAAPDAVLRDIVRVIGMRDGQAFFKACETLGKIVHFISLPEACEKYVLVQLDRLVHDTEYDYQSARFENEDRGDYRASAANLANQLYKGYKKVDREVPEVLKCWKEICSSQEELDSVRRMWAD